MQNRILTLTTAASRTSTFNYLADIENLPAWTGGFCEWIELHREGWWVYTALGEFALESKVDDIAGVIDLQFRHVSGWTVIIPLRVRPDSEGGAIITVACRQVPALGDEDYERLFGALLAGLRSFATKHHPELAVA